MSAPLDRARLAAICGMLGSAHDGEVLNAARLAERLRQQAGATWGELLSGAARQTTVPRRRARPPHWRCLLAECRCRPAVLTPWERQFITSLAGFRRISRRQYAVLARLAGRARREAA